MDKITFFDGSNYLRRMYENVSGESGMRSCVRNIRTEIGRAGTQGVFVFDGAYANDYRKAIYPDYKNKRKSAPSEFYIQVRAFERIVKHLPIVSIRVPEYEADDVIGQLAKGFVSRDYPVHIKSTDRDFQQIEGVSIEGKTLDLPSDQIILYKVLVGDNSDNIAGVPGFGPKKWEALDKDAAKAWLQSGFDSKIMPQSFNPAVKTWCESHIQDLNALREVCVFRDVPETLLVKHTFMGVDEPTQVEEILKEYMA